MKSKINLGENISNDYPLLKQVETGSDKLIVLFTKEEAGVVVFSERKIQPIGYTSSEWMEADFNNFTGTIELSNN